MHAVVKESCVVRRAFRCREIGAAGLADEKGIAREYAPHAIPVRREKCRKGEALRRVPRGRERTEGDRTELQFAAVAQPHIHASEERMLTRHDRGPGDALERCGAQDKVLLAMGLEHVLQAQGLCSCELEVLADVTPRVDDRSEACAADQIGVVSNPGVLIRWKYMSTAPESVIAGKYGVNASPPVLFRKPPLRD